jgi:hypothetical protein
MCPYPLQRKRLLVEIKESLERYGAVETKMMSGQPLAEDEQDLYDVTSSEGLAEKIAWLDGIIKSMATEGQLTAGEKQELLAQIDGRIAAFESEVAAATAEGKPKKAEKAQTGREQAVARREHIAGQEPVRHPLKHEEAIKDLRVRVVPLLALEALPGLRSMDEMKKIGTRPDMEAEVERLEAESRGWFEADADFAARCALVAAAAAAKAQRSQQASSKKAATASKAKASDSWETVGSMGGAKDPRSWKSR